MVTDPQDSILAHIADLLTPIMKPIGLGDWKISVSLISGFLAKESVVSTMEVLYADGIAAVMAPITAAAMLVFSLLYTPCVAAVASVRRELGRKWAVTLVLWQCLIAWLAALLTVGIANLLHL